MEVRCPRCGSKGNELIECDNCGTIGCVRCIRKSYGKWICYKCEEPKRVDYYPESEKKDDDVTSAFSAMFG